MTRQPDESDPDDDAVFVLPDVDPEEQGVEVGDEDEYEALFPLDDAPPLHCPWRFFNFSAFELGADAGALGFGLADLGTGTRVGL